MAKAVPKTVAELTDLIAKSGVCDETQLAEVRALVADCKDSERALERLLATEQLTSWQAEQLRNGQFVLKLGDYRLLNESDTWDFGRAFLAAHVSSGQHVSLKLLSSRLAQDEGLWKEFVGDLRKVARLQHANLAPFRDLTRAGGRQFLISDVESTPTLEQRLAIWGTPGLVGRASILVQAAEALEAIHERELIHGCLSFRRVRVDDEGRLRISDIGLQRLVQALGDKAHAAPLAPPSDWKYADQPKSCDLYALGGITERLEMHVPARQSPPLWWSADVKNESAQTAFTSICRRLRALEGEPYLSAAELLAECRKWCSVNSVQLPAATVADSQAKNEKSSEPSAEARSDKRKAVESSAADDSADSGGQQSTAAPAPTAIVINTEKRRKRRAEPAAAQPVVVKSRKRSQLLIVTCTATAIVVLFIVAISFLNSRLRDNSVADAGEAVQQKKTQAAANSGGADQLETNPVFDSQQLVQVNPTAAPSGSMASAAGADIVSTLPQSNAATEALANAGAANVQPAAEQATPDATNAAQPGANEPAETMPPENTVAANAGGEANQPAVPSTPESDTPPASSDTAAPHATETSAAPSTSDAAPTDSQPMPPAANPYEQLPTAVALPKQGSASGAPTRLAAIAVDDETPCYLTLIGGERAGRGQQMLTIENAAGGTLARQWDVFAVEGPGNRTPVAQFGLLAGELTFAWTDKASSTPLAALLQNCLLQITIKEQKAVLGLREPMKVKPLVLDLDRGLMTEKWSIDNPPDPASCRFELVGLEGPFPPHALFPPESIAAADGSQWILLGQQRTDQVLALHVQSEFRRTFTLKLTSISQQGEDPVDAWLKDRERRTIKVQRTQLLNAVKNQVEQGRAQLKQVELIDETLLSETDKQKKNLLKVDLDRMTALLAKLEALEVLCQTLNDVGRVHFRLVYEVDGEKLELLRTGE